MTERVISIRSERVTIDDEIDRLEQLVAGNKVEAIVNVARVKHAPGVTAYIVMTMGEPLASVHSMLRHAIDSVEAMIGKPKD